MVRPLKLYNHPVAPNPRRVRIFAAEKGIELALEDVDILTGQSRSPEFLAKNSSAAVPVLELDDGSYLSESIAICRYLEGLQPEPNLLGRDVREQAEIDGSNSNCSIQSPARLRIPIRSFNADLSSFLNMARRSAWSLISVLNGWIRNWTDMSSSRSTALRLPISPP
jgi:glutathione S-transferase